ncbi:DUF5683 domain-containing protein [candidate division CSSED10-310 bacterium]|uniref:DUF5683 domain-containing protein n=1 Tax=candidate division CSSED10-310 bacterium TaxID=2855610 RepID=A0ABV6YW46_UNCC1
MNLRNCLIWHCFYHRGNLTTIGLGVVIILNIIPIKVALCSAEIHCLVSNHNEPVHLKTLYYDLQKISEEQNTPLRTAATVDKYHGVALTPLTRSVLIPGWGQLTTRHYVKGSTFVGIAVVSLYLSIHYNHEANQTHKKYQAATELDQILHYRNETEDLDIKRNQAIMVLMGNHIINILDMLFFTDADSAKPQKNWSRRRWDISMVELAGEKFDTPGFQIMYRHQL